MQGCRDLLPEAFQGIMLSGMEPKNLLFIQVDQWPGYLFHALGADVLTPTLDSLAEGGIRFTGCQSSCPVCIPARRSLMTGTYPRTHGDRVYKAKLAMPGMKTLAQCFSEAGYQTYAVGKLHVYPQRSRIGFDDVILMEEGRYELGAVDDYQLWLGDHGYTGMEFLHGMGNNTYVTRPWHLAEEAHPTVWATRQMCRQIERRDPTRPCFFYMSYQFPHPPLVPLQAYLDMYPLEDIRLPEEADDWKDDVRPVLSYFRNETASISDKERKMAIRAFYAQCTLIDHQVRLLIGTLREAGMTDSTVICFLSDHGEMLFHHDLVGKRIFYNESSNVPFFITGKPMEAVRGTVDPRLCSLEDVMPTLLGLFGIPVPETVEGIDILNSRKDLLFGEISEGTKATRMATDGVYKLIYYPYGNVRQLFNILEDPHEHHDLYGKADCSQLESFLIESLYGEADRSWVKDGQLVGVPVDGRKVPFSYDLINQRGLHWPVPDSFKS